MTSEEQYQPLLGHHIALLIWGRNKKEEMYDGTVESLSDRFLLLRLDTDSGSASPAERVMVRYSEIKHFLQYFDNGLREVPGPPECSRKPTPSSF